MTIRRHLCFAIMFAALFGCRQREQSLQEWMHEHAQGCPQCQPRIDPECPTVVKELNRRAASDP